MITDRSKFVPLQSTMFDENEIYTSKNLTKREESSSDLPSPLQDPEINIVN